MRLLITGDWHLRARAPGNRLGDFKRDRDDKLDFLFNKAQEETCEVILQPGDMGDSATWSDSLKRYAINLMRFFDIRILNVAGQHDLKYHSLGSLDRTSLGVLQAAGVVELLDAVCLRGSGEDVWFYGASFGEKIPEPNGKAGVHVLVAHTMVLSSEKDKWWPGQRDYSIAKTLLRRHLGFDLIVTGDNHIGFCAEDGNRLLVNCGALMRMEASKQMMDHKPFLVIYDTKTKQWKQIYIPIRPADEVLDRKKIEDVQERNEQLEAFVESLSTDYSVELDFDENMREFLLLNKDSIGQGVRGILEEVFDGRDSKGIEQTEG